MTYTQCKQSAFKNDEMEEKRYLFKHTVAIHSHMNRCAELIEDD